MTMKFLLVRVCAVLAQYHADTITNEITKLKDESI